MEVQLSSDQQRHADYLLDKIQNNVAIGDTSPCGAGKTFIVMYLAQQLDYPLLVFCPNSVRYKWEELTKEYQIEVLDVVNYDKLSGKKSRNNLPWIEEEDGKVLPSPKFLQEIQEGALVVFDEVHFLKNPEAKRTQAAFALTRAIPGTPSRCTVLSNTPFVEVSFALSLLRLMGIIRIQHNLKLSQIHRDRKMLSQLIGYCGGINQALTDQLRSQYPPQSNSNTKSLVYHLYTKVVKAELVSSAQFSAPIRIYNRFYQFPPEDRDRMERGYSMIKGKKDQLISDFGSLSRGITLIEEGKLPTLTRVILARLKETTQTKIIVFLQRVASMIDLKESLKEYSAEIVNGETPTERRKELISLFQTSNTDLRVLITSTRVSGTGLDLDDQEGSFPREVYLLPSYSYIDDYQGVRRVSRLTTKSIPVVNYLYCRNGDKYENEKVLLNQLRKSSIHQEVVNNEKDMMSAFKHIDWYEPDHGSVVPKEGWTEE